MVEKIVVRGKRKRDVYNYFIKESHKVVPNEPLMHSHSTIETSQWKVCLSDEKEYKLGIMVFPEVEIRFEGECESVRQIMHDFRIEFLSAGG